MNEFLWFLLAVLIAGGLEGVQVKGVGAASSEASPSVWCSVDFCSVPSTSVREDFSAR